jgi:hypothetical protein
VLTVAGICVAGAVILVAARQPSAPAAEAPVSAVQARAVEARAAAEEIRAATMSGPDPASSFPKQEPVTITGCLEQTNSSFRLMDTAGEDAPKARSWKSAFLKKSPRPIEVIDDSHRLKLPAHVGERVSVTGVLMNREMQGRALQRVAAACN